MKESAALNRALKEGRRHLTEVESKELLKEAGIPVIESRLARSKEEALSLAREMGFPVVFQVVSPNIVHKSDIGGVKLGLGGEEEVA
ncbi:MAG: acetate--CoA ligase family protein, partial [Dehalococcoidia bacterium]